MIIGKCLCGDIEFSCDINTDPLKIYQCHCTLCKKQSGSSSNSATIVAIEKFRWLKQDSVKQWQKSTGFSSHFCANCGSPVPNIFADKYYWIPVGLLELKGHNHVNVVANLCLSSQSSWHMVNENSENYDELPELTKLLQLLS